jgi:hypothetical protein
MNASVDLIAVLLALGLAALALRAAEKPVARDERNASGNRDAVIAQAEPEARYWKLLPNSASIAFRPLS